MFWCNNERLLPGKYTVKEHISNSKLEKGDHYYIKHGTRIKRSIISRSRSNCIPPMHSCLIVAKSLPSRPPFFAWIWVGIPVWWEAPESDTFTISIVVTSFPFRTILLPQQSEQPRPASYCFCCDCSTIPYRRIWRYIVNIDETLVSKATLKSDCIWGD